jgi:nitrogen fixation protein
MSRFLEVEEDGLPTYILKKDVVKVMVTHRDEDGDEDGELTAETVVIVTCNEEEEYEVYGPIGFAASIIMSLNEGVN